MDCYDAAFYPTDALSSELLLLQTMICHVISFGISRMTKPMDSASLYTGMMTSMTGESDKVSLICSRCENTRCFRVLYECGVNFENDK